MVKIHKESVKRDSSVVLSSKVVLNNQKMIYLLNLERKKVLFRGIYDMKNFFKQVSFLQYYCR